MFTFPVAHFSAAVGGFAVDNSAVFNKADSEYFAADSGFGTPSNADIGTISIWFKRGNLGGSNLRLFTHGSGGSVQIQAYFKSDNTLVVGNGSEVTTTQVFRDVHAFYHLVVRVSTGESSSSDRVRLYLNGSQISSFSASSYPGQNDNIFTSTGWRIGSWSNSTTHTFDGYMAEVVYCDGQSLAPTAFGETDDNGVWRPIDISGAGLTFGNNGFHLNFASSGSDLGDDASGNSNDFTNTNSVTQTTDSPTNNHAVITPLDTSAVLSEGNLVANTTTGAGQSGKGSIPCVVGDGNEYVFEAKLLAKSGLALPFIGVADAGSPTLAASQASADYRSYASGSHWISNGQLDGLNTNHSYGNQEQASSFSSTFTTDDVIGVVVKNSGAVHFYKNGSQVFISSDQTNISVLPAGEWFPSFGQAYGGSQTSQWEFRFGDDMSHTYGSAVKLTTSTLNTAQSPSIEDGTAYMQSTTYTGNGSTQEVNQTGNSKFKPDLLWLRGRESYPPNSSLYDVQRSDSTNPDRLTPNLSAVADNDDEGSGNKAFSSFDADGFSFQGNGNNSAPNATSKTMVAWQWLASNTTGSVNNDGSLASLVSANQTSGFSIVRWSGNRTNSTIGHGLGSVAPKWFFTKALNAANGWRVYHAANTSAPETEFIALNSSLGTSDEATIFNDTAPSTSSPFVFTVGTDGGSNENAGGTHTSNNMIAYCWAEIPGFSKFGSYEGNGDATNGPYVHLGFTPQWLMIKGIDQSANSWMIYDTAREPNNPKDLDLTADTVNAEDQDMGSNGPDFLSNGFKFQSSGTSQGNLNVGDKTFIYMAFAEHPFAGSTPATAR